VEVCVCVFLYSPFSYYKSFHETFFRIIFEVTNFISSTNCSERGSKHI